ncbi:ATP-binding mismatch repair protein [Coemansia sp. RSA 1933]|nr:ATP-binding mismatch repair protein [Coemansia sp. RSA 1933]
MKAIEKETVHRLCSGQVIVDLATTVKELVENSLDAGATHVEIRMKDSGLAGITVVDNGMGIGTSDHATLCRKHWTSKISAFEDLEGIGTFGFRGEALSSLCGVSTVTVTTATEDTVPMGMQLEYRGTGELALSTPVARERGTTVQITELFGRWPVRLQDLRKNIKREYMRAVALVEQYAIISDTARVTMTNQPTRGAAVVAVRTPPGSTDRLLRLGALVGMQARQNLVHFQHKQHDQGLCIDGHVTKPIPGAGRSAADKQYFFVNGRPCDFARAKRLVNDAFRAISPTRYPVFAISISIGADTVDVNLTPDKRTLMLRHEQQVLGALREALAQAVAPSVAEYPVTTVQPQAGDSVVVRSTAVPGVSRCYPTTNSMGVAKRLGGEEPSVSDAKKRQNVDAESKEITPPFNTSRPTKKSLTTDTEPGKKNPTGLKRLPQSVVDLCKNRIQKNHHDWTGLRQRMQAKRSRTEQLRKDSQDASDLDGSDDTVRDGGINSTGTQKASAALSRLIHKHDFARMHVVGQFNRGFIVTRMDQDLYIVDQHASDEKYNFEQLQQRAVIASQPLIQPMQLHLSIVDESVAIEHRDTLMRNGFHIRLDETQEEAPGHRVWLVSQPIIDNTLFDQTDLMELVGKLCTDPSTMPRCERARRMFASRACRKSTMIGDPLSLAQMHAIVRHLSTLDHPWNCPHGRPTMRHLHRLPPA